MVPSRRAFLTGRRQPTRVVRIDPRCMELNGVVCRVCVDACPRGAIRFIPLPAGLATPRVDPALCDACGECLSTCPAGAIAP